jgi:hypothetical protein
MLEVLRQSSRPTTFLKDMLFKGPDKIHATKSIRLDKVKGSRGVAPYVSRNGGPVNIAKPGQSGLIHDLPYSKQQMVLTPDDLDVTLPGNGIYTGPSPTQILDERVATWMAMLQDQLIRLEELQCAKGLLTGIVPVTGKDVDYEVNFQMLPAHKPTLTGADRWSETTSTKLDDLRTWSLLPRLQSAPTPSVAIMDLKAADYFVNDEDVYSKLNNRRIENGSIKPQEIEGQDATYIGNWSDVGLNIDIYCYYGSYEVAGVDTPYMPDNTVIMTNPIIQTSKHYGRIDNFKHGTFVGKTFPMMYDENDGSAKYLRLESGPLMATDQVDGVVTATVV